MMRQKKTPETGALLEAFRVGQRPPPLPPLLSGFTDALDPPAEFPLFPPIAAFPPEPVLVVSVPDTPVPALVLDPDVPVIPPVDPVPLEPTLEAPVVPPPAPPLVCASAKVELNAKQEASAIVEIFMSSSSFSLSLKNKL
jgi:hypothetical protein